MTSEREADFVDSVVLFIGEPLGLAASQDGLDGVGSRPLEWCIDGHSVISYVRLCGEFGGQGGLVGF
jgi:hypothetical protein